MNDRGRFTCHMIYKILCRQLPQTLGSFNNDDYNIYLYQQTIFCNQPKVVKDKG